MKEPVLLVVFLEYAEEEMSEIKYKVIFSRRRSVSIIVSPDKGVVVRAPYRTSLKSIDRFIAARSSWIIKHVEKHSMLNRISRKKYVNGEIHLFLGKELTLRIVNAERRFVRVSENHLEAGVESDADALVIRAMIERWYRAQAIEIFKVKVSQILERLAGYGFNLTELRVRSLRSRWGSCSSKGKVTLNTQLVKLDARFVDYVIIHELCHLKHHNHGKEFHNLLGELIPDYKILRKELRNYLVN